MTRAVLLCAFLGACTVHITNTNNCQTSTCTITAPWAVTPSVDFTPF